MPLRHMGTYEYKTEFVVCDDALTRDIARKVNAEMLKGLRSPGLGVIKATA